jgi:hypothetical protein
MVASEMRRLLGTIEGGFCVCRVEERCSRRLRRRPGVTDPGYNTQLI